MRLAGGAAAARDVAGLGDPNRPAANFLVDLASAVNARLVAEDATPASTLIEYLDYLAELRAALDAVPGGLALPPDQPAPVPDPLGRALDLLGLRVDADGRAAVPAADAVTVRRQRWLLAIGIDSAAVGERLSRGETVTLVWRDDELPLPLPDLWQSKVFEGRDASVRDLVATPRALLLYLGLVNLDRETLDWLGSQPDLFETIFDDASGSFAAFARSLRVRGNAVEVPGGAAELAVWEDLVGARATDVERFVTRLLDRRDGRLAYFYDTAAQLDRPSRAFMLGAHLEGPARWSARRRFVRRVYDQFAKFAPTWRAHERPFFRPVVDPALVLAVVDVASDGTAGPSWWTAVLEHAATACRWTREPAPVRRRPAVADAAWMLGWVFDKEGNPEARLAMLRLLQRRFSLEPEASAGDLEVALCARLHMPALVLSLDRMRVGSAALHAELVLASRRLTRAGDAGLPTLRAWQAAIALVEQWSRQADVPAGTVEPMLASLADAAPETPGDGHGAIAGWVFAVLLDVAGVESVEGSDLEARALGALAGLGRSDDVEFEWDGLRYRLDRAGAAARSASTVRDVAMGPRLEHIGRLLDAAARLEREPGSAAAVEAALVSLGEVSSAMVDTTGQPIEGQISERIAAAMRSFERASSGADAATARGERQQLLAVVDMVTGDVLPAMAYALAMSPVAGPPEIYAESYRFHDLGDDLPAGRFETAAWSVPRVVARPEGGSRVSGALLGLDLARAPDRLRRPAGDGLADSPVITEADYTTIAARLVLRARVVDWEAAGRAVAQAIARGRQIVSEWAVEPPPDAVVEETLAAAAMSAWRASIARWLIARGDVTAIRRFFTMTDFHRLGTSGDLPEAWGQSGWLIESCWCLRQPTRRPPEDWLGRTASLSAAVSSDLPLRLTELLDEIGLPHALVEPLLPMAAEDAIEHARQISTADWEAFAWPRDLEAGRLESYLLALLADGLLVAPRGTPPRVR